MLVIFFFLLFQCSSGYSLREHLRNFLVMECIVKDYRSPWRRINRKMESCRLPFHPPSMVPQWDQPSRVSDNARQDRLLFMEESDLYERGQRKRSTLSNRESDEGM
mmetsp:Transcript_4626/g.9268  ORF Transcript_4626/g.9268 Transcript_4626/m.9268 type:complete len:106 (-) Transcript_4626:592-909(-)